MIYLAAKDKIQREYLQYEKIIEQMVEEELKRIKGKAEKIKTEAREIGKSVEKSLDENADPDEKKKS